jgi:hypothetical protein
MLFALIASIVVAVVARTRKSCVLRRVLITLRVPRHGTCGE